MKKLNNALNDINDKYIEEAAQADRLTHSTAKIVRNIAVPVVSAAAVAGLCFGIAKLGIFGAKGGVDLLPATSDTSTSAPATVTTATAPYQPNDYQYEFVACFPDSLPLVMQTQSDIESIVFGSEFPEMVFADETNIMFTDGIGGLYIFDTEQEELTFAADLYDTFALAIDEFPNGFGGDSWNGISIFAAEDGTPYCSLTYYSKNTTKGAGESVCEYYLVHTQTQGLERIDNFELKDLALYSGLEELPYNSGHSALSLCAAHYGDSGEYAFIRNCTADIDLAPMYDMQLIELRRWSEDEVTSDAADGGWFPFVHEIDKTADFFDCYAASAETAHDSDYGYPRLTLSEDGTFTFVYRPEASFAPNGTYEIAGDLIRLNFGSDYIMYRLNGTTLYPCAVGEFAEDSTSDLKIVADVLLFAAAQSESEALGNEHEAVEDELQAALESDIEALQGNLSELQELKAALESEIEDLQDELAALKSMDNAPQYNIENLEKQLKEHQDNLNARQYEIDELTAKIDELRQKLDAAQNEEDKLAMYLSMLRRGSSFDGNYVTPEFVNMLDGEWFISTYHGYDSWRGNTHNGIDIPADMGDPIYAAADGTARVPDVDDDWFSGYGNTVVIMHDGGYFTVYAHTNEIHVSDGERVTAGQHIADIGSSGWSTGPHLHFEIYKGQTPVDPAMFDWFGGQIYNTDSLWYAVHCALDGAELPDKPESMFCPVDINYEFTSALDDSGRVRFSSLEGAAVLAAADGEVIAVTQMKYEQGVCVAIKQTDGFVTLYHSVDNCIVNVGDRIKAGLKIGQIGEWLEVVIDILGNNKERVQLSPESFSTHRVEDLTTDEPDFTQSGTAGMTTPVSADKGQIVELMYGYGGYYGHQGIDIAAEYGTPVYAALGGKVVSAEWNGDYGYYVMLEHDNGLVTTYGHLSDITAELGDTLAIGEQLGAVGSTGRATGNHLHFEVLKGGEILNPMEYLPDYLVSADCVVY